MPSIGISALQFLRWREEIQSFDSLGLMRKASVNLTGSGLPETLGADNVSAGFFETLGVAPLRGHWFQRSDEKRGARDVAIISARLWGQRFSADPQIVGRKIVLDGVRHEIVGVTRPDLHFSGGRQLHPVFDLSEQADIFLPLRFTVAEEQGCWNIASGRKWEAKKPP